jgi:aryl-alcohol dehydrogenase-like predicted oxidoreductase
MPLPADEELALAMIAAAAEAGITVFDTARAYGGNERPPARALHGSSARIVTKGGMPRPGGAWVPDGRAKAVRADCEASLEALDGLPIDLYLLHTPDPRTPWRTLRSRSGSARRRRSRRPRRALERQPDAARRGARTRSGDGRPGRAQASSNERAARRGVVGRCAELGIALIAHSPLGGPRRAPRLARLQPLAGSRRLAA